MPKPQTEVKQIGSRLYQGESTAELPYIMLWHKVPNMLSFGKITEVYARVLASILDGGNSSRFAKELIHGKENCSEASASYSGYGRMADLFTLGGMPAKGQKLETVKPHC